MISGHMFMMLGRIIALFGRLRGLLVKCVCGMLPTLFLQHLGLDWGRIWHRLDTDRAWVQMHVYMYTGPD